MERTYHCIDCGRDFVIDSKRNTHAKRCPDCRKVYRSQYLTELKRKQRATDKTYAKRMKQAYELSKFNEDPIAYYKNRMVTAARSRAKRDNIPFNITVNDIEIPQYCPILGIPLRLKAPGSAAKNGDNVNNFDSPSLDRIIPSKGYTKGNVWVISYKANNQKNDMSLEDIEKLYYGVKKKKVEMEIND